jgi:hypothetical protein
MKSQKSNSVNKLLTSFDNQLKNILMNDLSAVRKNQLVNAIQNNLNSRLNAA